MRLPWRTLKSTALAAAWTIAAGFVMPAQQPVKLDVQCDEAAAESNQPIALRVTLLDAANRPVPAWKDLDIAMVARFSSQEPRDLGRLTIPTGKSAQTTRLKPLERSGFVYIWAKHPELRNGGLHLAVRRSRGGASTGTGSQPPATEAPTRPPSVARPSPEAISGTAGSRYILALRYSPLRGFLANGKDSATVHAFVVTAAGEPNSEDVLVNLFDSSGTMRPTPLLVRANQGVGTATLTSDSPGEVVVEYRGAKPATTVDGERALAIRFEPPITKLQLRPSPERISLVDSSDLIVRLVDEKGTPTATLEPRRVSLTLEQGRGLIETKEINISAGQSDGRTSFDPTWWGTMTVAASTPNLMSSQTLLRVDPPVGLLTASMLGGLTGGALFFLRFRRSKKWRIPVGALTGLVLYWSLLLLGLSALPRAPLLNPITAFVIAVLGGWLGLEVFEPILRKLGLAKAPKGSN